MKVVPSIFLVDVDVLSREFNSFPGHIREFTFQQAIFVFVWIFKPVSPCTVQNHAYVRISYEARYLSVMEAPHNTHVDGFFQTAETGNRTPNSKCT